MLKDLEHKTIPDSMQYLLIHSFLKPTQIEQNMKTFERIIWCIDNII
jgi:hypothetical protein